MRPVLLAMFLLSLGCPAPTEMDPIVLDASPSPEDMSADVTEDVFPDMTEDTPADTPPPCPECPPIVWDEGPALPASRDHHMTLVHEHDAGASLIVIGGIKEGSPPTMHSDVWVSALSPEDGSMGPWTASVELPYPLAGTPVIVSPQGVVLLTSGRTIVDGRIASTQIVIGAKLGPDGIVGEWGTTEELPVRRFHHAGSASQTHAYLTGGLEVNDATDTVIIGEFAENGSISSWREGPVMPETRTHHSSFIHANHLYVVGGFSGALQAPQRLTSVHRAEILENGDIGPWETEVSTLPINRATHANTIFDGHVYLLGGLEEAGFTGSILRAPLLEDGVGPWEPVEGSDLPRPTGHTHHTPTYGPNIYVVSGGERLTLTDRTHHGTFHSQ